MTNQLINIFYEGSVDLSAEVSPRDLSEIAEKVISAVEGKNSSLSLILCDDPTIHDINRDYRKKDSPTDVISFAYREEPFPGEEETEELGDIYISVDTARRQALEYEVTFLEEMKRLIIHGILHLVGYDHEVSPEEEQRMEQKEEELFKKI